MGTHVVARTAELPPGERKIVELEGRSIGVFNVDGHYYALRNVCPHQGGPLCLGKVTGTALPSQPGEYRWGREGEIIVCPWHAWEFEIKTGRSVFNPHRTRVRSYDVTVATGAEHAGTAESREPAEEGVETFTLSVEEGLVLLHL